MRALKILLGSLHRYPSYDDTGSGLAPRESPSGAPALVHDLIARGVSELGHTVYYALAGGCAEPLPPGVHYVDPNGPLPEVDIHHNIESATLPWVRTWHGYYGDDYFYPGDHDIFVSHALARSYGYRRVIWNGLDPAYFRYRPDKSDYLLFLASMQGTPQQPAKYAEKGLPLALSLCQEAGVRLVVAGSAEDPQIIATVSAMCKAHGAEYIGDIRGRPKAELIASARALLFPTQVIEGFGLVIVEALLSGTPVITSDLGACPELVPHSVGFVCSTRADYLQAIETVDLLAPETCRALALERYHYKHMATRYVEEYERAIALHRRYAGDRNQRLAARPSTPFVGAAHVDEVARLIHASAAAGAAAAQPRRCVGDDLPRPPVSRAEPRSRAVTMPARGAMPVRGAMPARGAMPVRGATPVREAMPARGPSGHADVIGRVIAGRYRVDAYLASGTTSRVYRAMDTLFERNVVLKLVRDAKPAGLAVLRREARVIQQLRHRGIIKVHDFGEADGFAFIAMEPHGLSLAERILQYMPVWRAADISRQLAEALHVLHEHGFVHCDVRPWNILTSVDDVGRDWPKLIDFGCVVPRAGDERYRNANDPELLSRRGLTSPVRSGMSVEQHRSLEADPRYDVLCLGAVLGMMLIPGIGEFSALWLEPGFVHDRHPIAIRSEQVPLADGLRTIIQRCVAEPSSRYRSAREVAEALQPYCKPPSRSMIVHTAARTNGPSAAAREQCLRVIINADDLGYSQDINDAIFGCMDRGEISSATLMANGPAFDDAVARLSDYPHCSFGVHLNVTEFAPLTDSPELAVLLGPDSAERLDYGGMWSPALTRAVELEWDAQIQRLVDAGVPISHVDSHHHVHTRPCAFGPLVAVLRRFGQRRVRLRDEGEIDPDSRIAAARWNQAIGELADITTTDRFTRFVPFVAAPPSPQDFGPGRSIELMVHPGHASGKEARLLSEDWRVRLAVPVQLIAYHQL